MRPHAVVWGLAALLVSPSAHAFFEAETADFALELRGNLRINQTLGRNPEVEGLPEAYAPDRALSASFGLLRLMLDATVGEHFALEVHVTQLLSGSGASTLAGVADGFGAVDGGRTGALSYAQYDRAGTLAELGVDRLAAKVYLPFGRVVVGRQPVNLATTYFFTPNDFFQAFSAQAFFRVYKAGVDAARVDVDLGELSQLSLIGVLGYADPDDPDDRVRAVSGTASAVLARVSATFWDFEWSALGGKAPYMYFAGVGLQGEVLDWLGVRIEGHVGFPEDEARDTRVELAVGLEHRFESSLHVRAEYYFNGPGADGADGYPGLPLALPGLPAPPPEAADPLATVGTPYLGRHYAALGLSYELTALLTVDAFALANLSDRSFQVAAAFAYSLLDEVDLSVVVSVPVGDDPRLEVTVEPPGAALRLGSELGAAPIALSAELRAYF